MYCNPPPVSVLNKHVHSQLCRIQISSLQPGISCSHYRTHMLLRLQATLYSIRRWLSSGVEVAGASTARHAAEQINVGNPAAMQTKWTSTSKAKLKRTYWQSGMVLQRALPDLQMDTSQANNAGLDDYDQAKLPLNILHACIAWQRVLMLCTAHL